MISDEELAQLPEEPELAFIEFERTLRGRVEDEEARLEIQQLKLADEGIPAPDGALLSWKREYITKVLAAARAYGVPGLDDWTVPSSQDDIEQVYINFTSDVDFLTMQLRIRQAPRDRQNSVGLDGNTKAKIHYHISG